MVTDGTAQHGPPQVRDYSPDDPLTNAERRGELLCARLAEVGVSVEGPVLDLGCGYGGLTLALRRRQHQVWSLDRDLSNLEVVRDRLRSQGLPMTASNGSALDLPFRDGTFRSVLMIGVLEWVGFSSVHGDPRSMQVAALREVARVLEPGGQLVLATKNRLFPRFAWSDAQLGLPLVNLLPRRAADAVVQRVRGHGYRSRIYSAGGWARLLAEAGLVPGGAWTPRYTYQYPLSLLPFEARGSTRALVEARLAELSDVETREALLSPVQGARGRFYDVIEQLGVHRHLAAGFVLSATRPG